MELSRDFNINQVEKLNNGLNSLSRNDFKELISQLNELTRSAEEATKAYADLAMKGIKPTRQQLKEFKKNSIASDRMGRNSRNANIYASRAEDRVRAYVKAHGGQENYKRFKDSTEYKNVTREAGRARQLANAYDKASGAYTDRHNAGLVFKDNRPSFQESARESIQTTFQELKEGVKAFIGKDGVRAEIHEAFAPIREFFSSLSNRGSATQTEPSQPTQNASKANTQIESSSETSDILAEKAKEAQQSAESIVKSSDEARNAISSIGDNAQTASPLSEEAQSVKADADVIVEASEKANTAIVDVGNEKPTGETLPTSQIEQQLNSLRGSLESTGAQLAQSIKTEALSRAISDYENMIKTLKDYDETLKGLATAEKDYQDDMAQMRKGGLNHENLKEYQQLENELAEIREQRKLVEGMKADLEKKRPAIEKRLISAVPKEGKKQEKQSSSKSNELQAEQQQAMNLLGLLKETLATKAQIASAKTSLPFSSDMQGSQAEIKALGKHMKELDAIWKSMGGGVVVQALSAIGSTAKNVATAIGGALVQGFKSVISGAKQLASTIFNLASGAFNALKSAISTTLGNMRKLVSGGFNAVRNGVKSAVSGFNSLKSHMQSIVKKGTPNLMKSFSSLKSMLMRRIKRTFISSIFNQAKEGLQQLAKSSDDFNRSMSNIKNTAKQSAGNLSMVLGNLIQTLEPALMTLLGWFNSVMEAINGLFALLGGKSTMLVAKKATDDYAKSLGGAGGAAKDLNHQLYGFDELTRQDDDSGGGGGGGSKIEYEEQEVAQLLGGINDFFQQMMEAFQAGQFERVGELIAEQLNNLTKIIDDWVVGLRPKATEWASNIARIINGIFSNKELFENLGKLIADGLNLAFDVVNTFLKTIKFDEIGKALATAINSLFEQVEWDLVGETFATYFNSIWTFLGSTFEEIDWQNIGYKLSIGFGSLFENLDWEAFKKMWSEGVNGVFEMLYTFVDGIDWGGIAGDIDSNLTDLITNKIKWSTIKDALSESVTALQDVFHVLANSNFFINLASKLSEVFGGVLDKINWDSLVSDIGVGLAKLKEAFWSLIDKVNITGLASDLSGALNKLMTDKSVQDAWDSADAKAKAGIQKIIDAIGTIVKPASEGGLDVLGLAQKLGKRIGKLVNGDMFVSVAGVAKNGLQKITDAFSGFVEGLDLTTKGQEIANGINTFFDPNADVNMSTIASRASEGINEIIGGFTSLVSNINFSEIAGGIASGIQTLVSEVKFDDLITAIGKGAIEASTAFFGMVDTIFKGGTDEAGNVIDSLGTRLAKGLNGIFKKENGDIDEQSFVELGESIGDAIVSVFTDINKFITQADWGAIGQSIGNALGSIDWIGIASSMITLLWNALVGAVKLAGGLIGAFIRKLFGITDVEAFNATGVEWAQQLAESVQKGVNAPTTQQKIALCASAYATGLADDFLNEMNARQETLNMAAEGVASNIYNAIQSVAQTGDLDNFAYVLASQLNIGLEEAKNLITNSELSKMSYEDILSGFNGKSAEEVTKWFKDMGANIPSELANQIEQYSPLVAKAGQELMANLQNAKTLEEAKAYFAKAGLDVGDEFASKIAGESTANIASALMLLGKGVDEATINALDTSNLSQNLETYMRESGASITEVVAGLMYESGKTIEEIEASLGLEAGTLIAENLPKGVAEGLKASEADLKKASQEAKDSAKFTSEDQTEMKTSGSETAEKTGEGFVEGMDSEQSSIETATENVLSPVEEKFQALPDDVKPYAEQLIEYVCTALADKDGTVRSAIEAVAQGAVDRAKEILNGEAGLEIVKDFVDGIKNYLEASTTLALFNGENGASSKLAMAIKDSMMDVLTESDAIAIGSVFASGVKSGISSTQVGEGYDNSPYDWAVDVASAITTVFGNSAYTIGNEFGSGILYGLYNADAYSVADSWAWIVLDVIQGKINAWNGETIGANMVIGMINGFNDYGSMLVSTMAHICRTTVSTAREILGIHSPSKVFEQIGDYVMEGMQIGLEDSGKDAIQSVADVTKAMTAEGESAQIKTDIGIMVDGLDNVTSKMTRLAQIFSDIGQTIAEMGKLDIPAVASGRVIPYNTNVNSASSVAQPAFSNNNLEDALFSAFNRAMGMEQNQQPIEIKLVVDGRTLADIVTKKQREQSRAWGV